jgi:hypothetical protein
MGSGSLLAEFSVPAFGFGRACAALQRGLGTTSPKRSSKGWYHTPCLLQPPNSNTQLIRKDQTQQLKSEHKKGEHTSMAKNISNILNLVLTTFLISASNTACQTTSAAGTKGAVKVLNAQDELVEAVLKERQSQKVQDAVKDNVELAKAEAHLRAALVSLKASNQTLKEVLNHDAQQKRNQ